MSHFGWLKSLFRDTEMAAPLSQNSLQKTLSVLAQDGATNTATQSVRRFAASKDKRYCGMTMLNYESFVVDLVAEWYVHYPNAGVTGFIENKVLLSPDEERFSLEPSGVESFEVDLLADSLPWICPHKTSSH